jgi:nucleoside-diphosphate-sugar epimerase
VHFSSSGAYSPRRHNDLVDENWPTEGISSLPYSQHKAAAERLLDAEEARQPQRIAITRVRPALVGHELSGGALLRNTYPAWLPTAVLSHLPLLPLDRGFRAQFIHSEDLSEAVVRIIEQRATGAFNLASEGEVHRDDLARILGAPALHLPWAWLRHLASISWRARLQPVDPGWLDLALAVPRMTAERARRELGWTSQHTAVEAVSAAVDGMRRGSGTPSPILRRRELHDDVLRALREGPPSYRHLP